MQMNNVINVMPHKLQRRVSWLLLVSFISGCGINPYQKNLQAEQVQNDASFLDNSYLQACGAGIALAVVAAWATADGGDHSLARYLTASGIGCGLALGANFMLQKVREGYKVKQEDKLAALNTLKQENVRVTRLISSTQTMISQDKQKIQQAEVAFNKKQISLSEARSKLAEVDSNTRYLRETLAKLEQRKNEWMQLQAELQPSQTASEQQAMQVEIEGLQEKITILKQELLDLEKARSVSSLG